MSRYRPNHKSFGAFMKSAQLRKPVREVAKAIALVAKETAPRSQGQPSRGTKHMADQFKVRGAGIVTIAGNPRVAEMVYNDSPLAAVNELGNRKRKGKRALLKAGMLFGDPKGKIE